MKAIKVSETLKYDRITQLKNFNEYKRTYGGFENKRTSGQDPKYSIVEIGQNTKKRILAVTKTPVENHKLTLV